MICQNTAPMSYRVALTQCMCSAWATADKKPSPMFGVYKFRLMNYKLASERDQAMQSYGNFKSRDKVFRVPLYSIVCTILCHSRRMSLVKKRSIEVWEFLSMRRIGRVMMLRCDTICVWQLRDSVMLQNVTAFPLTGNPQLFTALWPRHLQYFL